VEAGTSSLAAERHGSPQDPYRIFFPLGILLGIAGVSIWPLYYWGVSPSYSGRSHAFVQTDCFLYAFIAGFLWTAIPKFTGTTAPSRAIQYFLALLLVAQLVAFELQYFAAGHLMFIIAHSTFIAVVVRCFIKRRHPPPETFVFVGLGLFAGMIGAIINAGIAMQVVAPALDLLGKRLLTEGMVLLLVLGVGGFLGPRLLGFAQIPNFQNLEKLSGQVKPPRTVVLRREIYATAGFLLLISVIAEYGLKLPNLAWLRASVATLVILMNIRPWRTPVTRTTLAWCVWTAHWLLIAALWLVVVAPRYRIDFLHVMFIGGFTLLILAVGTRVVLSHGGHALTEEKRSWPLRIGLVTGIIAMLARIGAPFSPESYFGHLAWAAELWIVGMGIWGFYLLRRIIHLQGRA
jgi:uncharacterized protein involved in response to NO